ncbi:MAG: hypothetical protein II519_03595, partial [Muribaculaceae bacterium]|nr:hypothetical protein [Muribaculaceae bacterium]
MPLFYSTNNRLARVTLEEAVITGLAPDGGLYMPEDIPQLPRAFIDNMAAMSLHEVAYAVIYYALQGDGLWDLFHAKDRKDHEWHYRG